MHKQILKTSLTEEKKKLPSSSGTKVASPLVPTFRPSPGHYGQFYQKILRSPGEPGSHCSTFSWCKLSSPVAKVVPIPKLCMKPDWNRSGQSVSSKVTWSCPAPTSQTPSPKMANSKHTFNFQDQWGLEIVLQQEAWLRPHLRGQAHHPSNNDTPTTEFWTGSCNDTIYRHMCQICTLISTHCSNTVT